MNGEEEPGIGDPAVAGTSTDLVSIVIPCYNHRKYVSRAIRSALAQTHPSTEILVIDDGSTDGSREVAEGILPKVRVISQSNQGLAGARNTGIGASSGRFLLFLDSDDWLEKDAVERMLGAFRELPEEFGVVGSRMSMVFEDGRVVGPGRDSGREWAARDVTWEDLIISGRCARFPCSALVKREVFVQCGGFDPGYGSLGSEDRDMWIRAASRFKIRRLPDCLLNVSIHGENMSADPGKQLPGMRRCLWRAWRSGGVGRWRLPLWLKALGYYFYQASIMHLDRGNRGRATWNSMLCLCVYPLPGLSTVTGIPRWSRLKRMLVCARSFLRRSR